LTSSADNNQEVAGPRDAQKVVANALARADAGMSDAVPEPCLPCEIARQKSADRAMAWTPEGVCKILCEHDKAVVEQLRTTTIKVADSITYSDPYYDGTKWTTQRFQAGGNSDATSKLIGMLSGLSDTEAATTIYHEIWHQNQPRGMPPAEAECDAYYNTEVWTIARGLPGDQGGALRETDARGKIIASRHKVEELVQKAYPVPPKTTGPAPPHPVDRDVRGNTVLSDGSTRLPRKGDRYYDPSPPAVVNEHTIPPGDAATSPWRCPQRASSDVHG
jgi:hypothetical protein